MDTIISPMIELNEYLQDKGFQSESFTSEIALWSRYDDQHLYNYTVNLSSTRRGRWDCSISRSSVRNRVPDQVRCDFSQLNELVFFIKNFINNEKPSD